MGDISRLFDFTSGDTIRSQDMDDELNQLVNTINSLDADNLSPALAAMLGVNQPGAGTVARGKSIIGAQGTRTNGAFGALSNGPDQVAGILMPSGGKMSIAYSALWSRNGGAPEAAIFIGGNQLKTRVPSYSASPVVSSAPAIQNIGVFEPVMSCPMGLASTVGAISAGLDVGTGQTLGWGGDGGVNGRGLVQLDGGGGLLLQNVPFMLGGACEVHVDPGTYTVSVQFRDVGGSTVNVNSRKLWVEAKSF